MKIMLDFAVLGAIIWVALNNKKEII